MLVDERLNEITEIVQIGLEHFRKSVFCINLENVANWFYEETPEEFNFYRDFPNMAPPWPMNWFEFTIPPTMNLGGKIVSNSNSRVIKKVGIFRLSHELDDSFFMNHVVFIDGLYGFFPLSYIGFKCDSCGKFLDNKDKTVVTCPLPSTVEYIKRLHPNISDKSFKELIEKMYRFADSLLKPVYFANSLVHCKNVQLKETDIPIKLISKRKKKSKLPFLRFNTVVIDAMKTTLKTEGKSDKVGLKKALHICRGHFATYTEDAPLFGRVTGTFWKSMHLRGNKKVGVVVKDYQIKAPSLS